jgi:hypothetical protein
MPKATRLYSLGQFFGPAFSKFLCGPCFDTSFDNRLASEPRGTEISSSIMASTPWRGFSRSSSVGPLSSKSLRGTETPSASYAASSWAKMKSLKKYWSFSLQRLMQSCSRELWWNDSKPKMSKMAAKFAKSWVLSMDALHLAIVHVNKPW